jgi:hypothetical protein
VGEKFGIFEHPVGAFSLGARKFCASAILDGQHDEVFFSNRIDNPIIALANPIEMVQALKFGDAGGTWMSAECIEPFHENVTKRFGECVKVLLRRRSQKNGGNGPEQSEPQFFQYGIERLRAVFVCLSQGCAGLNEIDTDLQGLQESQVIDGHHRSDCSATSAQQDTFVAECCSIDGIGEPVSLLIAIWISHGHSTDGIRSDRQMVRWVQAVQWIYSEVNRRMNSDALFHFLRNWGMKWGRRVRRSSISLIHLSEEICNV